MTVTMTMSSLTETAGLGLELRLAAVWAGAPRLPDKLGRLAKPNQTKPSWTLEVRLCALAHYVTRTRPGRAFLSLVLVAMHHLHLRTLHHGTAQK